MYKSQAFPDFYEVGSRLSDSKVKKYARGLSLRDYFAAKAMQGLCTAQTQDGQWFHGDADDVAKESYNIADAMLAERGKAND